MKNKISALTLIFILITGCSFFQTKSRHISSTPVTLTVPRPDWHFSTTTFNSKNYVYTPFFVDGDNISLYTGGLGSAAGVGVLLLKSDISGNAGLSQKKVIAAGPNLKNYNYFRAPRVARNGSELWMLVEIAGCYSGCDTAENPKRLATYYSKNDGVDWQFLNYVKVDGEKYIAKWMGHTGLIYNAKAPASLDLKDLTNNRFITTGENRDIMVSADGVNFKSIAMNHPFAGDRLVFSSIAKTPYGFHLMSSANWNDKYFTTTIRHLFSKDLINWSVVESNSFLKNPKFYKGVHLSYDEKAGKLWALSPCGTGEACDFIAWLDPKAAMEPAAESNDLAIGEYVFMNGVTAMIVNKTIKPGGNTYQVRFWSGTYDSGFTKEMFTLPLKFYQREGCIEENKAKLCVGDTVYVNETVSSIMGFNTDDPKKTKYAVKFSTGIVDTGYTRGLLKLP